MTGWVEGERGRATIITEIQIRIIAAVEGIKLDSSLTAAEVLL